ncbi:MAG: DUF4097 family beta strand repeat protein [Eubacterium sp.]|nr:DUF4097 family beta strand repeat protein [Eubacterium sp.]
MNRKRYLWMIALITVACIIGGSIWHGHRGPRHHWIEQEIREELRDELEDDQEDAFEDAEDTDDIDVDDTFEAEEADFADREEADDDDAEDRDEGGKVAEIDESKYEMIPLEGTQKDGAFIPFENIDIVTGAFDINIKTGQDYSVTYYLSDDIFQPVGEIKDGTLYITQKEFSIDTLEDFIKKHFNVSVKAKMVITVPEGTEIGTLSFKNGAGDTLVKDLTIDTLTGHASAGDFDLENATVNTLDAKDSAGDIDVNNSSIGSAMIDCSAGDIELEDTLIKKVEFDNSAGNVELEKCQVQDLYAKVSAGDFEMTGTENLAEYNVDLKASAGDIRFGNNKLEDSFQQSGKDGLKIVVRSSAGDITIQ